MSASRTVLCIVHHPKSRIGLVEPVLREMGLQSEVIVAPTSKLFDLQLNQYRAAIIFGSAMSANSSLPWVSTERSWCEQLVSSELPILGICFGAQLLSLAVGGVVQPHVSGAAEFGYLPLYPTVSGRSVFGWPPTMRVWQWHTEGFAVDERHVLATGDYFEQQAYRIGRLVGLQFHPEIDESMIRLWYRLSGTELHNLPPLADQIRILEQERGQAETLLRGVLNYLVL